LSEDELLFILLLLALIAGLATSPGAPAAAATVTLYNSALGTTPDKQGFFYLTDPFPPQSAAQSFANGATALTSLTNSDKAGYFARSEQVSQLDRAAGYTVRFTVQMLAEAHASQHRAGFSVIVLSSDLRGVELGFWQGEIWAQDDGANLFRHAEGALFHTTAALITYDLTIVGDSYTLASGGAILRGPLRDYSSSGWPYNTPNFLFLGDDTSSAGAQIRLALVAIETGQPPTATPTATATPTSTPTATATPRRWRIYISVLVRPKATTLFVRKDLTTPEDGVRNRDKQVAEVLPLVSVGAGRRVVTVAIVTPPTLSWG
jgi:hypothetical protein